MSRGNGLIGLFRRRNCIRTFSPLSLYLLGGASRMSALEVGENCLELAPAQPPHGFDGFFVRLVSYT